jgi:hypothetical protein
VLEWADGSSSLVVSLSSVAQLLEGCIDVATANGICLVTRSALATTLSHFSKLGIELKLLGSECSTDLVVGQVDALWTQVRPASDLLALYVPPLVAYSPPNGTME